MYVSNSNHYTTCTISCVAVISLNKSRKTNSKKKEPLGSLFVKDIAHFVKSILFTSVKITKLEEKKLHDIMVPSHQQPKSYK